jgi:hypothetical protein
MNGPVSKLARCGSKTGIPAFLLIWFSASAPGCNQSVSAP